MMCRWRSVRIQGIRRLGAMQQISSFAGEKNDLVLRLSSDHRIRIRRYLCTYATVQAYMTTHRLRCYWGSYVTVELAKVGYHPITAALTLLHVHTLESIFFPTNIAYIHASFIVSAFRNVFQYYASPLVVCSCFLL